MSAFAIDRQGGELSLRNEIPSCGVHLFVANKESDTIVVFGIDPETGRLTPTGQMLKVPSPVCLKFVAAD